MGINHLTHRPAVFLDRDGVINENVLNPASGAWESPLSPDQLTVPSDTLKALHRFQSAGFLLFVVSNQPNYAKGKASMETLDAIHRRLAEFLRRDLVQIAEFYYCFHHPEGVVPGYSGPCECRKPSPYFLLRARDTHSLNLDASWMIGDRPSDVECGQRAGVRTVRILNSNEGDTSQSRSSEASFIANGLLEASEIILASS